MSGLALAAGSIDQRRPLSWELRNWRVTTAARIFTLAVAVGLAATARVLPDVATPFLALCALAAVMSAVQVGQALAWLGPVAEGTLVALILGSAADPEPLLVCLTVAPLVAGMSLGSIAVAVTVLAQAASILGARVASHEIIDSLEHLAATAPYLLGGLGVGLLGAWIRSSAREQEHERAPYAAAHRLLIQLRTISRRLPGGLDTHGLAELMLRGAHHSVDARRAWLLVGTDTRAETLTLLTATGSAIDGERTVQDESVRECWATGQVQHRLWPAYSQGERHRVVLPLRVGDRVTGVIVADTAAKPDRDTLAVLQTQLDEQSLRLETAILFDEVRSLATVEERQRLAREIHDGVAQELASFGYLVDDLAATSESPQSRETAILLRTELSRVVDELRHSIFDLRASVEPDAGLGQALTSYVREVGAKTGTEVHLTLRERSPRLRVEVETELLRIAQEAVTNVRKHSHAENLWVRLETDSPSATLTIEDDGVGCAGLRPDHFGLPIMRERAERIGATLSVTNRPSGGTVVMASIRPSSVTTQGANDVHHRAARR